MEFIRFIWLYWYNRIHSVAMIVLSYHIAMIKFVYAQLAIVNSQKCSRKKIKKNRPKKCQQSFMHLDQNSLYSYLFIWHWRWIFTSSSFCQTEINQCNIWYSGHLPSPATRNNTMNRESPPHLNYCAIVCLRYIHDHGIQYAHIMHIRYPRKVLYSNGSYHQALCCIPCKF